MAEWANDDGVDARGVRARVPPCDSLLGREGDRGVLASRPIDAARDLGVALALDAAAASSLITEIGSGLVGG